MSSKKPTDAELQQQVKEIFWYHSFVYSRPSLLFTLLTLFSCLLQYNQYKNELQSMAQKIGELESEVEEHK